MFAIVGDVHGYHHRMVSIVESIGHKKMYQSSLYYKLVILKLIEMKMTFHPWLPLKNTEN